MPCYGRTTHALLCILPVFILVVRLQVRSVTWQPRPIMQLGDAHVLTSGQREVVKVKCTHPPLSSLCLSVDCLQM